MSVLETAGGVAGAALNPGMATMGLLNLGAGIFGGIQNSQRLGDMLRARNDAAALTRDQILGNSMPLGSPWNIYAGALSPYSDIAGGMSAGGFIPDFWRQFVTGQQGQLDSFSHYNLPNYGTPDYNNSGFFNNSVMPNLEGINSRYNYGGDQAYNNFAAHGMTPGSQSIFDTTMGYLNGNNPYMQNQLDVGNYFLSTGGANPTNNAMINSAANGVGQGGWNNQIANLYGRGDSAAGRGMQGLGQGMSMGADLMNSPFSPYASGMMSYGMGGLDRFAGNNNPEQFLGPRGSAALDSLGSSPYIPASFANAQGYLNQATQNGGYTPQDSTLSSASFGRGFGAFDQGMQEGNQDRAAAYGNLVNRDELPSWFADMQNTILGSAGVGGMFGGGVSAGGGGGTASAARVSRDLGTMDPKVQELINKGQELFNAPPLLSMDEATNIARNQALSTAKAGFGQAMERAVQLGGAGPRVAGGGAANQALFENEDAALAGMSKAVGDARLGQQGLQLQRSQQGSDMAKAMAALDQQRQQMMMSANIADASNSTQASIAGANSADSAANRMLQASIANQGNSTALAQLRSQMLSGLLNNATELRGQNMNSNTASLALLPQFQSLDNQRMNSMFDNVNQAGNRANQRFGMGSSAFGAMDSASQNDINRWGTMINPLVAGQNTATNRAGLYSPLASTGLTAGLGSQDNRINTGANLFGNSANNLFSGGMGAMNNANNSATNNLNAWGNIFTQGDSSQINRMGLGLTGINNAMTQGNNFLGTANNTIGNANNYGLGSGQLANNMASNQNTLWNNAVNNNLDYARTGLSGQTLNQQGYNNYFNNLTNSFNPFNSGMTMANGNYNNIMSGAMNYMMGAQNLWSPYMGMMGMGQTPNISYGGGR